MYRGASVTNMGLVFYPKPQLDIVLHQTARDTYSYFDWWRAPAACINCQCILNLDIYLSWSSTKQDTLRRISIGRN